MKIYLHCITLKVIYTIKDSKTGNVMDSVERFVMVNPGGFIAGANVAYNDRLDGVVLNDDKITAVIGDDDDDYLEEEGEDGSPEELPSV